MREYDWNLWLAIESDGIKAVSCIWIKVRIATISICIIYVFMSYEVRLMLTIDFHVSLLDRKTCNQLYLLLSVLNRYIYIANTSRQFFMVIILTSLSEHTSDVICGSWSFPYYIWGRLFIGNGFVENPAIEVLISIMKGLLIYWLPF